ncbi:MAG: DEAD/DEAH box helicase [Weeksellaceae bacterium]|nr:DEAD/DEAH box helicase [Weeksellaceae bacterium]
MTTFEQMELNDSILRAVTDLGFLSPTAIQAQAIPQILESEKDLIALAQTGTGKTAAFGLPILQQLDSNIEQVQAIILCPTRELCLQISKDLESYSKYLDNAFVLAVYGGADIKKQIDGLKRKPQIVVGTPGRTMDLIKRGMLKINQVNFVVLDEADEMLNMGFREDIDEILEKTGPEKQTLLFSATMPSEIRRITKAYMKNPLEISIGKSNEASVDVEHHYYMVRAADRYAALKRIADFNPDIYAIVFCRTRRETKDIADSLIQDGYNADALHGDLSQAQRDTVMEKFRRKNLQLLVATDVAARGIDVNELTHVINYNLPDDPEAYVHRSGRTGRAGHKGISIIIAHSREGKRIKELEKLIHKKIERKPVPSGEEIVEKRLFASIDKIENTVVDDLQIEPYMATITKKLEWMDRDELLKRIVATEFNTFLNYYKNTKDLNSTEDRDRKSSGEGKRNYTRFFISIGQKQKLKAPQLIGLINDVTQTRDIKIGEIEILRNFSFFEADSKYEELILKSFKNEEVEVEVSNPEGRKKKNENSEEESFWRKEKRNNRKPRFERQKSGKNSFGRRKKQGFGGNRKRGRR